MARPAKHNWELLYSEYSKGGYKNVAEFAKTKDLHPVAVRREFKKFQKENPEKEQNETKKQNKTEQNRESKKQKSDTENSSNEADTESNGLTEKQRLFCLYFVKTFNATQAAIKAGYSKESAHVTGSNLIRNTKVKKEIRRLKGRIQEELFIDVMDVLNKYIAIAFADISDFLEFGQKDVQEFNDIGNPILDSKGNPVTRTVNFVNFKNSSDIDTSVIAEVKKGKDGIGIKLVDRMDALEKLSRYFDLLPDKHKRMIEDANLQLAKEKLELEKQKNIKNPALAAGNSFMTPEDRQKRIAELQSKLGGG